jgi:hypothetical protein
MAATASCVSVWMVRTMAAICRVASPERSARRCTSSATTLKPRPASPALAAWMAAFSASTLVCSVMSEISSVISPISCELSPRRLMRLEVSWIWSRMAFMPPIVFCTAAQAGLGRLQRLARHLGRLLRLRRHVVDAAGHLQHRLAGLADLAQLLGRGGQQLGRGLLDLRGGLGHARPPCSAPAPPVAQFLHGVVHRVGDGAGDVFGHRGLLRQVAFGHRLQLVHQPQNGRLVGVVDALGFLLLALGLLALGRRRASGGLVDDEQAQQAEAAGGQQQRRQPAQQRASRRSRPPARPCCRPSRPRRSGSLSATMAVCASRAATRPCRLPRMALASVRGSARTACQQLLQRSRVCGVARAGQAQFGVALDHALGDLAEGVQVLAEQEHGLGLTPSVVRNSLALLPMRCVSITSWPTADSSAAEAPPAASARHRLGGLEQVALWRLMARSAAPTCVSVCCCVSTMAAFFSALSTSGSSAGPPLLQRRRRRRHVALAVASGCARCAPAPRRTRAPRGRPRRCRRAPATPTWPAAASALRLRVAGRALRVGGDDIVELRIVGARVGAGVARAARDLVHETHVTLFG